MAGQQVAMKPCCLVSLPTDKLLAKLAWGLRKITLDIQKLPVLQLFGTFKQVYFAASRAVKTLTSCRTAWNKCCQLAIPTNKTKCVGCTIRFSDKTNKQTNVVQIFQIDLRTWWSSSLPRLIHWLPEIDSRSQTISGDSATSLFSGHIAASTFN